jgi:TonB family protein
VNKIFLLAILISGVAHAVLASIGTQFHYLGGSTQQTSARPGEEMTVRLEPEQPEEPDPPKPPELDDELLLGAPTGQGFASFAAEGAREQLARLADNDQSFESLDPRGSGTGGESSMPQMEVFAQVRPPVDPTPPSPVRESSQPAPPLFGVAAATPLPKLVHAEKTIPGVRQEEPVSPTESKRAEMTVPATETTKAEAPDEAPSRVETPQPVAVAAVPQAPAPPSPPTPVAQTAASADPAPKSDSEVDPFSTIGSVEFREGTLEVRTGRQVKPRRPKLGLAGVVSVFELRGPRVVLDVTIDATGKVTGAEIVKSSGKVEIDQPTRVAMYDWWFEPKRDPSGNPVPDRFRFEIGFH